MRKGGRREINTLFVPGLCLHLLSPSSEIRSVKITLAAEHSALPWRNSTRQARPGEGGERQARSGTGPYPGPQNRALCVHFSRARLRSLQSLGAGKEGGKTTPSTSLPSEMRKKMSRFSLIQTNFSLSRPRLFSYWPYFSVSRPVKKQAAGTRGGPLNCQINSGAQDSAARPWPWGARWPPAPRLPARGPDGDSRGQLETCRKMDGLGIFHSPAV